MRLNRFLASAGLGSRRSCEELIRTGQVTINGVLCETLATTVSPNDVVKVGSHVMHTAASATILLHKPPGFLCTASDTHERRTIFELLPPNFPRLFHVGRLDRESEGLIILTNDGVLANRLMHPRYGVPKTYVARVRGKVGRRALGTLRQGVDLEDGLTAPAEVNLRKQSAKTALVDTTIHAGRKRQVRRMFEAVGLPVEELHRRRYGPLGDKGL